MAKFSQSIWGDETMAVQHSALFLRLSPQWCWGMQCSLHLSLSTAPHGGTTLSPAGFIVCSRSHSVSMNDSTYAYMTYLSYPSIILAFSAKRCHRGLSSAQIGWKWGHTSTVHSHTPRGILESRFNLNMHVFGLWRKPSNLKKTHACKDTKGEQALYECPLSTKAAPVMVVLRLKILFFLFVSKHKWKPVPKGTSLLGLKNCWCHILGAGLLRPTIEAGLQEVSFGVFLFKNYRRKAMDVAIQSLKELKRDYREKTYHCWSCNW